MIAIPLLLAPIGAAIGGQINRAIYQWAWNVRQISPWSEKPEKAEPRTWFDCLPILGWWKLRRETELHGTGFWVRPLLIELCWLIGLPLLYVWSVTGGQLEMAPAANVVPYLQLRFLAQAILLGLMTIATFIDFDEKTIPDFVTVPGTIFALVFAWLFPKASLLPVDVPPLPLTAWAPWPPILSAPNITALAIGLGCLVGWGIGILPRTIYFRRGLFFGLKLVFCGPFSKRNRLLSYGILGMVAVHAVLVAVAWKFAAAGGVAAERWESLASALIGLALAGGFVWLIRVVASVSYGVEALGFGDVTLMAMLGAFFGWQAGLMCFFIAPFTGLGIVLAKWLTTGNREVAFGPFICAGACIVLFLWKDIWAAWGQFFRGEVAIILLMLLAVGVVLMGVMLGAIRVVKSLLFRE